MRIIFDAVMCITAIAVCGCIIGSGALNREQLEKHCRIEDGYMRCQNGSCQSRSAQVLDACQPSMMCTNDEFPCRSFDRCVPRYFVGTEESCIIGKKGSTRLPCNPDEFNCPLSGLCLMRHQVRNGWHDCNTTDVHDISDEFTVLHCSYEEFQCQDASQRCIPREWVCDGADDCKNRSDESQCLLQCTEYEFRCETGQCIPRYRVLDSYNDCPGENDEGVFLECTPQEFRCNESGRCIPRSWVGDKIHDCHDESDETVSLTCLETEFTCHNQRRCLPYKYVCDGVDHCGDCSDEVEGCDEPRMWRCPENASVCIHQSYACDGFHDCPGMGDNPEYLPGFKCTKSVLRSMKTQCLIPQWTLSDNFPICEDRSDICFDANGTFTCARCLSDNTIISPTQICDGYIDCQDLTDECVCNYENTSNRNEISKVCNAVCYADLSSEACRKCTDGQFLCWLDEKCVTQDKVCNGIVDCPLSRADEYSCVNTPVATQATPSSTPALDFRCLELDPLLLNLAKELGFYDPFSDLVNNNATRCNGIIECARFEDECDETECDIIPEACYNIPLIHIKLFWEPDLPILAIRACQNAFVGFEYDFTDFIWPETLCNGIADCPGGEDEASCEGRFHCDGGFEELATGDRKKRVSINLNQTCDGHIDCLDGEDEKNCSSQTHFYCEKGVPLFVLPNHVMDGVQDCNDNSDECPPDVLAESALSSRENLIAEPALQILVWLMAVVSTLGNLFVWVENVFLSERKHDTPIGECNRTIITNLAVADFLMGIALFMIGSEAVATSGSYCENDKHWRISLHCNAIGVLTVLSSETSVFCLVALTCYRVYSVLRPFGGRHLKPQKASLLLIILWLLSAILAVFPLIPIANQTLVPYALILPSPYFDNTEVSWKEYRTFAGRMHTLVPKDENDTTYDISTWKGAVESTNLLYQEATPEVVGYFGYYSTDGVCIPRLFRLNGTEPLHQLTLVVITINFICLIFIIVAYAMIYCKSTQRVENLAGPRRANRAAVMQKKISVLIATDLCCWLPICIMTFISQSGIYISKTAYAIAAIVLLPINSSLNPVIYSGGFSQLRNSIMVR